MGRRRGIVLLLVLVVVLGPFRTNCRGRARGRGRGRYLGSLQIRIRATPLRDGGKDSGGDDLVAEVAEVDVAVAERGHVFRVAVRDVADDPVRGEVDVRGHHDIPELAVFEVGAAGPGVAAALDAGAKHLDALAG